MESTLQRSTVGGLAAAPALGAVASRRAAPWRLVYWLVTALLCLQMGFTAYAQLRLPQVASAFAHLGFPDYFRVELSWAKLAGVVLLLAPVPARLKEWAYAGFAIDLASALVAHLAMGDGASAWGWAAATAVLWAVSYSCWRQMQAARERPQAA